MVTGTLADIAVQAAPFVSWHRTAHIGMVAAAAFAIGLVTFLGLRAAGIGPEASLLANGKLRQSARLVVADFTASAEDTSLARVAAVVAGDLTRAGKGWIVGLRLVTVTGEELAAYRTTANDTGELLEAIERVSRKLRGRMGESRARVNQTPDLEKVTTGSLEAFRLFAEGARAVDVEHDFDRAVTQLKAAVAIDSQFAMAWRKLGVAYGNGRFGPGLSNSAYAKALRFRERLPGVERLRAEGSYNQSLFEDRPRAEQVYREMQQRFPTAFLLYGTTNYANLLGSQRRYARAESIARQIPPKMVQRYENLYSVLLAQGKIVAADSIADEMSRRFPKNLSVHRMRALRSRMIGDWDTSALNMPAAVTSAKRPSDLIAAYGLLADEMWMRGRFAEAQVTGRKWRAVDVARGAIGDAILVDSFRLSLIDVNFGGRPAEGVARLDRAGGPLALDAMPPDQRQYMPMLYAYALAGKATDAAAVLERMLRTAPDTMQRRQRKVEFAFARAEVALARKDFPAALRWADSTRTRGDGTSASCMPCSEILRARIYDTQEQPDSVLRILDRYLDTIDPARVDGVAGDVLFLPWALKRSGELHAAAGHVRKAVDRFESLITLWNKADPKAQPTVRDLRARVVSLRDRLPN